MTTRPQLSFWQIWNMCFGFLGIQVGFALQNANVSRIFQTLGASIDDIPILWIAAPMTGLLVQPIIGYLSDKTWNRFGRRRPYFLIGAICASAALFVMPNSPALWIAAGMLWIMDASINITMEPFRAFVGDMLPEEQRTQGFSMQAFFIGIGSVGASALPWVMTNWFDVANTAPAGVVPDSVRLSFYIGGAVLLLAVLWTVIKTKEYSPEQLARFAEHEAASAAPAGAGSARRANQYLRDGALWLAGGVIATWIIAANGFDKQLFVLSGGAIFFGLVQFITAHMKVKQKTENGFYEVIDDLFHMPRTMKQLAVVQFFSWFALFAMWIYTTSGVSAFHYGTSDTTSALFNDAANWVGVLFAAYNAFAALAAFVIPVMARLIGRKNTHAVNLVLGGAGLMSFLVIRDPSMLWIGMIGVGFAWASIVSMPYAILAGALPSRKMGVFMGIFNFFIVIPQLLAASVLGLLVRVIFDGEAIYALILGGVFMIIAALMVRFVDDPADEVGAA